MLKLFDIFEDAGYELFYVGGIIRQCFMENLFPYNILYKYEDIDIDLATNAHPEKVIFLLEKHLLPVIPIGVEFGTIGTIFDKRKIEITTYRCKESYVKGDRKPAVVFGDSLEEDLTRRDFRINAIAMDKHGNVTDPFNGAKDIEDKIIQTPLNPHISFSDDPLRMLRACRFAAKYNFHIAADTLCSMAELSERIKIVSAERIKDEFEKILLTEDPTVGLHYITISGLLRHAFPELHNLFKFGKPQGKFHSKNVFNHTLSVIKNIIPSPTLRWAACFHDVGKPDTYEEDDQNVHFYRHEEVGEEIWRETAARLKMSTEFTEHVAYLIREHLNPSLLSEGFNLQEETLKVSDRALRRFIRRAETKEKLNDLLLLSRADITSHREDIVEAKLKKMALLEAKLEKIFEEPILEIKLPKNTGIKVMNLLEIEPGPEVGKVMKQLEQMMIDGFIPEEELATEISEQSIFAAQMNLKLVKNFSKIMPIKLTDKEVEKLAEVLDD